MILIEGNVISPELLEKLPFLEGQDPEDFGLKKAERVADEISRCWADAKDLWNTFRRRTSAVEINDPGTTETRNLFVVPLLQNLLGYELQYKREGETVGSNTFIISHRDESLGSFPVDIIGCNRGLDKKYEGNRKSSHSMMQEYLNSTDHVYGIISNGMRLRLLRDNSKLVKPQYAEWDFEKMLEEDIYGDFVSLFRLLHSTRMPKSPEQTSSSLIETYYQQSIDEGNRVRDKLRNAVYKSLETLGNGFLSHPQNENLKESINTGEFSAEDFSRSLRRIVYRILFLMTSEERDLIFPPLNNTKPEQGIAQQRRIRDIYFDNYSLSRFRMLSEKMFLIEHSRRNLWEELLVTFSIFSDMKTARIFGINPLDGDLFSEDAIGILNVCKIQNYCLLNTIELLGSFRDERDNKVRINYRLLDVEELGSVYESLLDLHPVVDEQDGMHTFRFVQSIERKTTGSYYTRSDLVNELIKSALEPVMDKRLDEAGRKAKLSLLRKSADERKRIRSSHTASETAHLENALLSMKVCDPACGSGHFLLAAARRIARQLAVIRTGEEQPSATSFRECLREVIQHCIYGVDLNPDAVELCKLALWLEGHNSSKPLSFLDHRIRCGNSLAGIADLSVLSEHLPDDAFNPVKGDDKDLCRLLKKENSSFEKDQYAIEFAGKVAEAEADYGKEYSALENIAQNDIAAVKKARDTFEHLRSNSEWVQKNSACNLRTSAFFMQYSEDNRENFVTSRIISEYTEDPDKHPRVVQHANELQQELRFFHWPLEFPDVFENGGFDVMLGNPPWERIKLQEQEYFETRSPEIADAPNSAARKLLIEQLRENNDKLYDEFLNAQHYADAQSKFLRNCGRFELTARGDINTYSVFSELFSNLTNRDGRAGFIVPTGIATDDNNKLFFSSLIDSNRLVSLHDFENREKLFPSVDSRYKFCLLTIAGEAQEESFRPSFGFFMTRVSHLSEGIRIFELGKDDFARINPNTKTCPVFRTRIDAELTAKIYSRVPVLINESENRNDWGVKFLAMFHMSNDSGLFHTMQQLEEMGGVLTGNRFKVNDEIYLPLYESKFIWQYDHRFGSYEGVDSRSSTQLPTPALEQYQDPEYFVMPWYWVKQDEVNNRLVKYDNNGKILWEWKRKWMIGFRDVTNSTNERTCISTILPISAVGNNLPLIFLEFQSVLSTMLLNANFGSATLDAIARFKVPGVHLNFFILEQLPFVDLCFYNQFDILGIQSKCLELCFTSWDLKPLADDVWNESDDELKEAILRQYEESKTVAGGQEYNPPSWLEHDESVKLAPFKWHEERRAVLRAELDAIYAKLYGLTRDELRYILDPQDVYGEDFPGETFRVLKEKEIRKYGEYRTRRLVLEAWDRLEGEKK